MVDSGRANAGGLRPPADQAGQDAGRRSGADQPDSAGTRGRGINHPGGVRRTLLLGAVTAALALPSAALAASTPSTRPRSDHQPGESANPFTPGVPQSPAPAPTTTATAPIVNPTTTTSGRQRPGGGAAVVIAIGALVLLAGISFFIWRDARRRAPVRHRAAEATAGAGTRAGSKSRTKQRKLSPAERKRRKRGRAR